MKEEDERLHTRLSEAGALRGHYVPALRAVHEKNAARLREILSSAAGLHRAVFRRGMPLTWRIELQCMNSVRNALGRSGCTIAGTDGQGPGQ